MASKKKRPPLDDTLVMDEVMSKKVRQNDGASTSHMTSNKTSKHKKIKTEDDDIPAVVNTHPTNDGKYNIDQVESELE